MVKITASQNHHIKSLFQIIQFYVIKINDGMGILF